MPIASITHCLPTSLQAGRPGNARPIRGDWANTLPVAPPAEKAKPPNGLDAAIIREIAKKRGGARFRKVERGKFEQAK